MSQDELLAAIEERYSFKLPAAYRHAVRAGWIDTNVYENYTPIFNGEWLPLDAILEFDFQSVDPDTPANPGLIPFAQTPGGDPFLWYPARTIDGEAVVGLTEFGQYDRLKLDSPSLLGFCYRQALDQVSTGCEYEDEKSALEFLAKWRGTWFPLFPTAWQKSFASLPPSASVPFTLTLPSGRQESGHSFMHPDECAKIVARDLAFDGIDTTIKF